MYKKLVWIIALAVMLIGCQSKAASTETPSQKAEIPKHMISIQTYESLDELLAAFEVATASNAKTMIDDEKVYYLPENNAFGVSMQEVQAVESYFNCVYDNGMMLITKRYEDGPRALENMVANNTEVFAKQQEGDIEYYYANEDGIEYYLWIQDNTYLQLNIPEGDSISLSEVVQNIECMSIK